MPEIGIAGLVVILIVALVVFGPRRLPEIGRSLGKGMREFKDSTPAETREASCLPLTWATVRRRAGRRAVPPRAKRVAARPGLCATPPPGPSWRASAVV